MSDESAPSFPAQASNPDAMMPLTRSGMIAVPGGTFLMGSNDFYPEERPVHRVAVDCFWIDAHPVTNAEFRRFWRRAAISRWPSSTPTRARSGRGRSPKASKGWGLNFHEQGIRMTGYIANRS